MKLVDHLIFWCAAISLWSRIDFSMFCLTNLDMPTGSCASVCRCASPPPLPLRSDAMSTVAPRSSSFSPALPPASSSLPRPRPFLAPPPRLLSLPPSLLLPSLALSLPLSASVGSPFAQSCFYVWLLSLNFHTFHLPVLCDFFLRFVAGMLSLEECKKLDFRTRLVKLILTWCSTPVLSCVATSDL